MKKLVILIVLFVAAAQGPARAESLSSGQTLYVPAYSHITIGNRNKPFLLTVTVHVRNADPKNAITLTSVDYYDSNGNLIKRYLNRPVIIRPLSSSRHVVPRDERQGGSRAGFLVSWKADRKVNPPVVESVMIGAESQQGISFTSRGQVLTLGD